MNGSQNPEAAFLAMMTASATHEVRNVLAIIKESAGLVQDMVHLFERKGTLDGEKLHRTVDRIDTQVKRGADLLTSLNRLSHTLDLNTASVDLNEEVRELVSLSQRSARKRGHELVFQTLDRPLLRDVNQLHLHMALFFAMQYLLGSFREGARVTVQLRDRDGVPLVEFRGAGDLDTQARSEAEAKALDEARAWAQTVKAEIENIREEFGLRIVFLETTGG